MGRVTIGNLLDDYEDDKIDVITGVQAYDIEVVPRKMVEMIIERIKVNKSVCAPNSYAEYTLDNVLYYIESLLKQFEEDK